MAGAKRRQREADTAARHGAAAILPLARDVHIVHGRVLAPVDGLGLQAFADDAPLGGPPVAACLRDGEGGWRLVLAARIPAARPSRIEIRSRAGETLLACAIDAVSPVADAAAALLDPVHPEARARLLRELIEMAGTRLRLLDHPGFARFARRLAARAGPATARALRVIGLGERLLYARLRLDGLSGQVEGVLLLGSAAIRRNPFLPRAAGGECDLVVERAPCLADGPLSLLLFAGGGVAALRLDAAAAPGGAELAPFLEGLEGGAPATRAYLLECLKPHVAGDRRLAAALSEAVALLPAVPRKALAAGRPFDAGIEHAVPTPDGGLFVKGWLFDPLGLVEDVAAISPFGTRRSLGTLRHRHPRPDLEAALAARPHHRPGERLGFLAHAGGFSDPIAAGAWRFAFALRSGAAIELAAPPPPLGAERGRDAVLAALPAGQASAEALAECVAPAAANLHRAHLAGRRVRRRFDLGRLPARPAFSVVVPLYRNLDLLRFQLAAFAVDPAFSAAEILLVLDSPEEAEAFERLLGELHFTYGLPLAGIVHERNLGYAPAINDGASAAGGDHLVLLNSDVVPPAPGWLETLARSARRRGAGIVGPKLLFEDDSLQHAGLYFGRDLAGRWLNRHYYKGYPRDFPPANRARRVPAVTGACMLIERPLFEQLAGMCEDYIIGDYEDSDLCLRVAALGRGCWYEPAAELYHFERQSIARHAGYAGTLACDVNRLLHSARWDAAMAEVMTRRHASHLPAAGRAPAAAALPGRGPGPRHLPRAPAAGASEGAG